MAPSTRRTFLGSALAAGALLGLASTPARAAVWSSSEQWGNYTTPDGYILYNNIWGSGAGSQTIWANSSSNWGVWANHPNTGGIKSYPNAKKIVNRRLGSLTSLTSSYNVSVPNSGAYNTSYDIWDSAYDHEVMLWMNHNGAVGPLGTSQGALTLGGHTWNVYKGNNGANEVYSFLRTSDSTSGTVNILPILKWIRDTKGWWGDVTIGDVQFGYEITSSSGGLNFTTNSFKVSGG
ncbi:GH12 family glycosyl hydrolase domain-containing protein [Streptomyces sp. NPDC001661]